MNDSIIILPELERNNDSLSEEEFKTLEELILSEGVTNPLVVWKEKNALADGHHRKKICDRHGLSYPVIYKSFVDIEAVIDWQDLTQIGRRNISIEVRNRKIKRMAARGIKQKEIAEAVGLSQNRISEIVKTSGSDKLQPSQPDLTVTAKLKDELARAKEKISLLEALRLENSRIAAALEEAKKPQPPVALPEPKVVEKEVFVTPPAVEAELKRLRKQYEDEQRLESKKAKLEEDLARLRAEGDNERAKNTFLSLLDYIHGTRTATERIKAMAKGGTLTVEHLDESERLFMAMVAAGNDGMNTVREARGFNAENAGLRVVK